MVRDARALPPFRADPVRLFPAHPLAAGQPRESAASRQALARGGRALVPVEGARACRSTTPPRRCSRPTGCAGCSLANRVVVSPMAMYSARDGTPNDFHLVHYGTRAQGGAGLVYTEMTCVSAEGRITPGCAGLYAPGACRGVEADRRLRPLQHQGEILPPARPFRARRAAPRSAGKAMTSRSTSGNWPVMAASDVPWSQRNQMPRPMTRADMDEVRDAVRRLGADGPGGGVRHGRAPRRPRLSPLELHHPARPTGAPTNMAAAWRTGCASRSRSSGRCGRPGRRTGRCRCGSPPTTGWASSA